MLNIRPVSDLRNKFPEIEESVLRRNEPVYLTKNGYGTMVLLSIEQYSALTEPLELRLDEADLAAGLWRVLSDTDFAAALVEKGKRQAEKYSWEDSAEKLKAVCRRVLNE